MFTGESWQEGKIRFGLVLCYGEYNTQENNHLDLVSIWGKCKHHSHFFRWANVEFRSLPSPKEEISDVAGSVHYVTRSYNLAAGQFLLLLHVTALQMSEAVVHRLCSGPWGKVVFYLSTTHFVQGGAVRVSQAGVMRIPSVSEGLQTCPTLHAMFIIHYSIRNSLISEKDPG